MRTKPRTALIMVLMATLFAFPAQAQSVASGDFQYTLDGGGKAAIVHYTGAEAGTLIIPEQLDGHPVTAIGQAAFTENIFISVVLPAGLTSIAPGVFSGCESLAFIDVAAGNQVYEQVEGVLFDKAQKMLHTYPRAMIAPGCQIPEGTLQIGSLAFAFCKNLESIAIPDSVINIGESAFHGCAKLKAIALPKGLTRLEAGLFTGCRRLKSVQIPDGVTQIGPQAFSDCEWLRQVNIPYSVSVLEPYTFAYCVGMREIAIPGSIVTIGDGAFLGCDYLESVLIPRGVQTIGDYAFGECTDLKSVSLPQSVASIGENAFYACGNLTASVVENSYAHEYFYQKKLPFTFGAP